MPNMGHSDYSAGIGAVAASQLGDRQTFQAERRPLVQRRAQDEHAGHPRDAYLSEDELEEDEDEDEGADPEGEPAVSEIEPLVSSLRGPEQHVGLHLDVKL